MRHVLILCALALLGCKSEDEQPPITISVISDCEWRYTTDWVEWEMHTGNASLEFDSDSVCVTIIPVLPCDLFAGSISARSGDNLAHLSGPMDCSTTYARNLWRYGITICGER